MLSRLNCADVEKAKRLHSILEQIPLVRDRILELVADSVSDDRQIVRFKNMPRVCVKDIHDNSDIVECLVYFDDVDAISKPQLVTYAFELLDAAHNKMLSGQRQVSARSHYHRFEGDKTRVMFAYFVRQCRRSTFSKNVRVYRLKQIWKWARHAGAVHAALMMEPETPALGALTSGAPAALSSMPGVPAPPTPHLEDLSNDLLSLLPMFPFDDEDGDTSEGECETISAKAGPSLALCVLGTPVDQAHETLDNDSGAQIPVTSEVIEIPDTDSEHGDCGGPLVPMGGADEDDGYFPYPLGFGSPLPPGLSIGMPTAAVAASLPPAMGKVAASRAALQLSQPAKRKAAASAARAVRASSAPDAAALLVSLDAEPQYVARAHFAKLAAMKRPAAAPAAGPAKVLKRPAAAPAAPPAAPADLPAEAALGAFPALVAGETEHVASLRKCLDVCVDEPDPTARTFRLVTSMQRGTHHVQLYCAKKCVVQVTDKQFGSAARADAAAAVLAELFEMGASAADLQRCKNNGCILGVKCGKSIV